MKIYALFLFLPCFFQGFGQDLGMTGLEPDWPALGNPQPLSQTGPLPSSDQPDFDFIHSGTDDSGQLGYEPVDWSPGVANLGFARNLFQDASAIFKAPLDWERREWLRVGAVVLSIGALSMLDEKIAGDMKENEDLARTVDTQLLSDQIGRFGEEYSFAVLAGFYLSGKLFGSEKNAQVARDGFTSIILAGGVITPLLKSAVGRSRPNKNQGANDFKFFGGDYSMPSGHTTQAFALASVIAHHYDNPWIKGASYGMASLVGLSRIENDAHFTTDVLAGAAIGYFVGRKVYRLNLDRRKRFSLEPALTPQGMGLSFKVHQGRR